MIDLIKDFLEHIKFIEKRILDEDDKINKQLTILIEISKEILIELKEINKDLTETVAVKATIEFGTPTNK